MDEKKAALDLWKEACESSTHWAALRLLGIDPYTPAAAELSVTRMRAALERLALCYIDIECALGGRLNLSRPFCALPLFFDEEGGAVYPFGVLPEDAPISAVLFFAPNRAIVYTSWGAAIPAIGSLAPDEEGELVIFASPRRWLLDHATRFEAAIHAGTSGEAVVLGIDSALMLDADAFEWRPGIEGSLVTDDVKRVVVRDSANLAAKIDGLHRKPWPKRIEILGPKVREGEAA